MKIGNDITNINYQGKWGRIILGNNVEKLMYFNLKNMILHSIFLLRVTLNNERWKKRLWMVGLVLDCIWMDIWWRSVWHMTELERRWRIDKCLKKIINKKKKMQLLLKLLRYPKNIIYKNVMKKTICSFQMCMKELCMIDIGQ